MSESRARELLRAVTSMVRTARAVGQRNRTELGSAGTSMGILTSLNDGSARPGDLASLLQVGPSVVSRAVPPLEHAGLVARTPDPDDARAFRIQLTDAGRDRLAEIQRAYVDRVRCALPDWSDDDAVRAAELLRRLEVALAADGPSGGEPTHAERRLAEELAPAPTPAPTPVPAR